MARVQSSIKVHQLRGPRLPYPVREAEIYENDRKYLSADGVAENDGEGILYWVDTIVTADGGGSRVYDNDAASGPTLSGAYGAKAVDSVIKTWDPPKRYKHGIYVNLTDAVVEVCYLAIARNLTCTVDVGYAPGIANLVSRLVSLVEAEDDLIGRLIVRQESTLNLVERLTVRVVTSKALTLRVAIYKETTTALVARVDVHYPPAASNVVSRVTVRQIGTTDLVSRVNVPGGTGVANLLCRLYADQTP